MAWSRISHCNPHKACVTCGYSGDNLEVYEQTKGMESLGKQYWQHCWDCGCATVFYLDDRLGEYYCQVFKLVDLEAFAEMRKMDKTKAN